MLVAPAVNPESKLKHPFEEPASGVDVVGVTAGAGAALPPVGDRSELDVEPPPPQQLRRKRRAGSGLGRPGLESPGPKLGSNNLKHYSELNTPKND